MINKDNGIVDVELRLVATDVGAGATVEINISQTALDRRIEKIEA